MAKSSREVEILRELIAIPSVSSLSNVPMIHYAARFLDGWKLDRFPYTDASGAAKLNLIASTGPGEAELLLVCHTDTVPFEPDWRDAVQPRLDRGRIYGRGSCDVKGFLACVLAAISQTDIEKLRKPLAIALTADEEIGCVGAKFLARHKAVRSRFTVVGEPTGLHPVRAGKGYALAEIAVHGIEAHSAFPAAGRSAIFDAGRVLQALERVTRKLASKRNRDFDPPFTTLHPGLIRGGSAKNILAGECRITVEWRPIPGQDPAWAAALIRTELDGLARRDPGFHAEFDLKRMDPPFAPSRTRRLACMVEELTGKCAGAVSFGTEAAHLGGRETIVFGPGDMTVAHKSGEFVPVDELAQCVSTLRELIRRLCGNSDA